jgi:DNA segregation ATPase FtsK/SpoIIIE, S-DNA-T family
MKNSPYRLYTPALREPLPLRHKPYLLPAPPEAPEKPQKINWLRTLLPPFIMLAILGIVATAMSTGGFLIYTMLMMTVYPFARAAAYIIEKRQYDQKEAERKAEYKIFLDAADSEITSLISRQRVLLEKEFLPTDQVLKLAYAEGKSKRLWYRTNTSIDFLGLRLGVYDGTPSFPIEVPKDVDEVDLKDPLLKEAKKLKNKFQVLHKTPFLLNLDRIGSVAVLGATNELRYRFAHHLLLDILIHHRPDEVELYVLSEHGSAEKLWGWLRWVPHAKVLETIEKIEEKKDDDADLGLNHLVFGSQAIKVFLGRFENYIKKEKPKAKQILIVDVDGIQQYGDEFVNELLTKAELWNLGFIFVGGEQLPRSVRGVVHINETGERARFVDTRVEKKDIDEKEYHIETNLDRFPSLKECERVARSLSGLKLLGSSGGELLTPNISLFDVIDLGDDDRLTHGDVKQNWVYGVKQEIKFFKERELLQFPLGMYEVNGALVPYELNLLEARFGGKDAYHAMIIGTTGSGKSEFIKSLILGGAYKYPPQYLNFFCMDFKGGSTIDQLEKLPHVIGVMTNLDDVLAQRGLVAISYEIDRRQAEFKKAKAKDIWEYNDGIPLEKRIPHLVLVLDEFTRGLDMLNDHQFSLQDLLEKRLVPQGRSLGIYLVLANQVANAQVQKLMPNVGWKIALRVATKDQMSFIDSSLKRPKYAGRGYLQAMGEDPIEFQSGYSGDYVKYSNLRIKQSGIAIRELLPNGQIRNLKEAKKLTEEEVKKSDFLEINQLIQAILVAQNDLQVSSPSPMYLPPMPHEIDLAYSLLSFKKHAYRVFSENKWSSVRMKTGYLSIAAGLVDITEQCEQRPLWIDMKNTSPHLLLAGSQADVNSGLRSLFYSLFLSHCPDDVQCYMLEFGQGLREFPPYPHIGEIILEKDTEKIVRTIEFFEDEFANREDSVYSIDEENELPHLFLVLNNIAGLKQYENLYRRVLQLIAKESHKYGIHIIATALPVGTGTRVPASDLKMFKSRIVFPSVNHDNYWIYLELSEKKLVKLTKNDEVIERKNRVNISRAYWLCQNDLKYSETPLEIQLSSPRMGASHNEDAFREEDVLWDYKLPKKIDVLKTKYVWENKVAKDEFCAGVKWVDLAELVLPYKDFPSIWGVSGPRKSGKTNLLAVFLQQISSQLRKKDIDVFSSSHSVLTDYAESHGFQVLFEPDDILSRIKEINNDDFVNRKTPRLIIFDDINFLWERKSEIHDEIIKSLTSLGHKIYRKQNVNFVASFTYTSSEMRTAMSRDSFMREFANNRTGLCLGYEGDWLIDSMTLSKYTKKFTKIIPAGRGVFVFNGVAYELQSYLDASI